MNGQWILFNMLKLMRIKGLIVFDDYLEDSYIIYLFETNLVGLWFWDFVKQIVCCKDNAIFKKRI